MSIPATLNPVVLWGSIPEPVQRKIKHAGIAAIVAGGTVLIGDLLQDSRAPRPPRNVPYADAPQVFREAVRHYGPRPGGHAERYANRQSGPWQGRG